MSDNLNFYLQAISEITFEDKFTDDEEAFGIYRVPTSSGCIEFVKLHKGIKYKPHIHDKASAKFIFLKGKGKVIIGERQIDFTEMSTFDVPAGVLHGFILDEESIFLSVQSHPIQDRTTGEIDIRYK